MDRVEVEEAGFAARALHPAEGTVRAAFQPQCRLRSLAAMVASTETSGDWMNLS